ncbi:MAG: hydroxymethylglutaryl-CoA lyase [Ilumatobacteraceae bacterium]
MTGAKIATNAVFIRDVGPRDGLQSEAPLPVERRVALIDGLVAAGVKHIEIASFMRDDLVPAMANAEAVVAAVPARSGLTRVGLVANAKGAQRAVATGIDALSVTVSLSDAYSRKNVGRSSDDSLGALADVVAVARDADRPVDVVVSCAFGAPFDDVVMTRDLAPFIGRVRDTGDVSVTLADTTGVATPHLVRTAIELVGNDVGLHFHDTRGTALLNAHTGLEVGVRRFDTSVGGIGGSPFAPNASGNLATESLVALLHSEGFTTGIDLDTLIGVGVELQRTLGHPLPSPFVQLAG